MRKVDSDIVNKFFHLDRKAKSKDRKSKRKFKKKQTNNEFYITKAP